jgi:hypothetical protein
MMKRTGRCGHCGPDDCACTGSAATMDERQNKPVKNKVRKRCMITPGIAAAESRHNRADYAITE